MRFGVEMPDTLHILLVWGDEMLNEYFPLDKPYPCNGVTVGVIPPRLFKQERDWTCSMACLRTLLSLGTRYDLSIPEEDEFISRYGIKPGPHYSQEVKTWILGLKGEFRFGHEDYDVPDESKVWEMLRDGWSVAVNWLMSYDHWCVILGWYVLSDAPENNIVQFYDPYYNDVRWVHAPDLGVMWQSGNPDGPKRDYFAYRWGSL